MGAEIIRIYRQDVPALRFMGKKYGDQDRVEGGFGKLWGEWFENRRFDALEKLVGENLKNLYQDSDAYIGLMRYKEDEAFEYWIGMFTPENTPVPGGFEYHDFPKLTLGVAWLQGRESDVFMREDKCMKEMEARGCQVKRDGEKALWFFERYGCPRFTAPDANGNIILDICFHVN